ncbi:hypothetical protein D3273_16925 [Lichenibacterium minor]|uniref:Uncharacterized protein n=1 Tax=Lichenibacterium minor TaxID=2316528 RepID=A0A4Q2U4Y9_9HYPH|nr:hypothetical protein [Lichenibacterium minor]RYC30868.1 hypothetical protein D3273_16925 [Lichenibacterium minor]
MKNIVLAAGALLSVAASNASWADTYDYRAPNPTTTYYVCHHQAHYVVNDRAKRLKGGAETSVASADGSTVTIGRSPDVYLQTQRLVTPEWQSLSTSGVCLD